MKKLILTMLFASMSCAIYAQESVITEVKYNNKVYARSFRVFYDRASLSFTFNPISHELFNKKNMYLDVPKTGVKAGYYNDQLYLINRDSDIKKAIRSVLTDKQIREIGEEEFQIHIYLYPESKEIFSYFIYMCNAPNLTKLPDETILKLSEKILSVVRFNFPPSIDMPYAEFYLFPIIKNALTDEPCLAPKYYEPRKR